MKRKFFFFDIDGTLAVGTPGNQYVPESTKIAISKLKEAGHFVAIATGRSELIERLLHLTEYLRSKSPHIH